MYLPQVTPRELSVRAFEYIDSNELTWYSPRSRSGRCKAKKMRASFGRQEWDPAVPDVFHEIGLRAIEAIRERAPAQHKEAVKKHYTELVLDNLILNLYDPGDSIAAHQDPPRDNPAILGITFCENPSTVRTMRFTKVSDKKKKHPIITHDCSAYCFWGDAYTDWKHESMKNSKQTGRILSCTFRAKRTSDRYPF